MTNVTAKVLLSILVSRPDHPFLSLTIPHLVKMTGLDVSQVRLLVDTKPLSAAYRNRDVVSQDDLIDLLQGMKTNGVVGSIVPVDYSRTAVGKICRKWFGGIRAIEDIRGTPIYGHAFGLESAESDYIIHIDSDMLWYESDPGSWISAAIKILEQNEDIFVAGPRPGPPDDLGTSLKQRDVRYQHDPRGLFLFKKVTTRRFVVMKSRVESHLPLRPRSYSRKLAIKAWLLRRSALVNFEMMMSDKLERAHLYRADLDRPDCWALHTPDHGERFLKHLPDIIPLVEKGLFPPEQANDYDLNLDAWIPFIEQKRREGVIK
jgi:hypothetical protein